eukprot:CAMPEP_0197020814 /NCGR_PEP_ID=MMETSP1384-20130603/1692_1 /TAXON_ID=29189 /ORGANISM="Ammonia sp." /LENGTH=418 /DNA_ID=CAMNT_0042448511 /DNA_START=43 /DNA_END=1299 /DNA_ORIENTATION=+
MAAITDDPAPAELPPSAETLAKDCGISRFLVKSGYLYLIALNLTVLFYDNVPISLQVLSTSLMCIVLGSFGSLRHPESAEAQEVERLKPKDAYMFPVFGSIALCSFYAAIKYLPKYLVDFLAQSFFVLMSAFAVQALLDELAFQFFPSAAFAMVDIQLFTFIITWKCAYTLPMVDKKIYIPVPSITFSPTDSDKKKENEDVVDVKILNLITLAVGCVVAYLWYAWDQYWLFNNMIGISLSIQAISYLNPGSYYTAAVLLSLLFFYDIFWVFGTDVMVTVAKNLKAPIKLIFPRPAVLEKPNMLGLGDIVLPGIYIALLLRYDVQRTYQGVNFKTLQRKAVSALPALNMNTFIFSLVTYFLSLALCLVTMWVYEAAQPALLYIVPGIIVPVILLSYIRGDFNALWAYDEEPDEKEKKKD